MSDDKKTRKLALALFATDRQVTAYLEKNGEVVPFTLTTLEKAWKRGVAEKKPEGPWVEQALARAKGMLDILGRIEEVQEPKAPRVSGPPETRADRLGIEVLVGDRVIVHIAGGRRIEGDIKSFLGESGFSIRTATGSSILASKDDIEKKFSFTLTPKARDRHGSRLEVGDIVSSTDGSFYGDGRVAFIKSSGATVCFGRHMNSFVHLPGERLSLVRRKPVSL